MQRSDREVGREDGLDRWGEWIGGEVSVWIGRVWVGGEVSVWTVNRFRKTHREFVFGSVIGLAGPVIDWLSWIGCVGLDRCEFELSLTVGLRRLARWSDYREGSVIVWLSSAWGGSMSVARSEGVLGWALFLSLALSLFCVWPGNDLKWKWKCKIISGSKE